MGYLKTGRGGGGGGGKFSSDKTIFTLGREIDKSNTLCNLEEIL